MKLIFRYLAHLQFHSRMVFEIIWIIMNVHFLPFLFFIQAWDHQIT